MHDEMNLLRNNESAEVPKGKNVLKNKWILKLRNGDSKS
jgi:hypothetical protein